MGFPGGSDGEESVCNAGDLGSNPGQEDSPEKGMAPVFLPGEFHEQRSLAGYSPWGCTESESHMTEQLRTQDLGHSEVAIIKGHTVQ